MSNERDNSHHFYISQNKEIVLNNVKMQHCSYALLPEITLLITHDDSGLNLIHDQSAALVVRSLSFSTGLV